MPLEKGVFTLSIDLEFAWGYVDEKIPLAQKNLIKNEAAIIRRILALLDKYNIPATWAIVGHLLESDCAWENNLPHHDWPRPTVKNEERDWFWQHPGEGERDDFWFDLENVISEIKSAPAGHEIGSHSYAHLIFDDNTNIAAVKADLAHARRIHETNNLGFKSFVFPRNQIGHIGLLKASGLSCYRNNYQKWYNGLPGIFKRFGHIIDYFLPMIHTAKPYFDDALMVAIDDSLLLIGRNGPRRLIGPSAMIKKAKRGIEQAAGRQEVFQLWFHPSNFAYDTETQFSIFESILAAVHEYRQAGRIEIMTLSTIAQKL